MSTLETPVETDDVNLDDFSADFFGQKTAESEPTKPEEVVEDETTEVDNDDDTVETDDEDEDELQEEPDKKPRRNRAKERIEELNGNWRAEQRAREALEAQLQQLKLEQAEQAKSKQSEDARTPSEPTPTDLNEDGTEKYPLGEYDPNFIRDLNRHTLQQEMSNIRRQMEQEQEQKKIEAERTELQNSWNQKLEPAQVRYPDFNEKGQNLVQSFQNVDANYMEYLTVTLMELDHGPDVLYYLASNPDEASKIVNSGAKRATLALGAINAKFDMDAEAKKQARPKVSSAPTPPPTNKGSAVAVSEVPDDTDDLDAFSVKLFKK